MKRCISLSLLLLSIVAAWPVACVSAPEQAPERVYKDDQGRIRVTPLPMEAQYRNPWTPELEDEMWDRANQAIQTYAGKSYGNLYFENEKSSYPKAMLDFLAGNREKALKWLQEDDNNSWSRHTLMVDLFPSFTLKGQVRKYFFFGQYLDPAYKQRMYEAARIWTEKDPLNRPHPNFKQAGDGWTPEVKNSWVDTRNTDNLRAMRECSAYLFAEETGNKEVQEIYRKRIQRYVWALYNIGMGEWDSNNYLGHTITGYVNLYDFARDPQMRLLGKAALDWLYTAGAVKYWRGGYGGPDKRDYGGKNVWGCGASNELGFFFGDSPVENPSPSADEVHLMTSNYRPPQAVVALARKQFSKPCEMLITHPTYENWKPGGEDAPAFFETQYFGNSFQIGTLTTGSSGDVNGFKLMAYNTKRGIDHFIANSGADHSTKGISTYGIGGDNVAQYRNLIIWLNGKGDAPFQFFVPKLAEISSERGITFLQYERTWLALHPINLQMEGVNAEASAVVAKDQPDDQLLTAHGTGGTVCGFALEIGEQQTHGDFAQFKAAVLKNARLDLSAVNEGAVEYVGAAGGKVKLQYDGSSQPKIWRNGVLRDYANSFAQYQAAEGGTAPVSLGWKQGVLRVEAGGKVFTGTLKDAVYSFTNK